MPRNQNGQYFLPEPAVRPDEVIRSEWANNTTGDIAATLTDSLDRAGLGGMTGPLRLTDGTEATPALAFTNEPGIGLVRLRRGVLGLVFGGQVVAELSANGTTYLRGGRVFLTRDPTVDNEAATKQYVDSEKEASYQQMPDGSEALPGLAFAAEKGSGLYRAGTGDVGVSVLGRRIVRVQGGGVTVSGDSDITGKVTVGESVTAREFIGDGAKLTGMIPKGTVMLFAQSNAPVGWTKITTHNNKALRVVSGSAGSGGSVAFTSAFSSQNVGNTSLTANQIPSHSHSFSATTNTTGNHAHSGNTANGGRSGWFAMGGYNRAPDNSAFTLSNPYGNNARPGLDNRSGGQERVNYNASHSHSLSINANGNHAHSVSGVTGGAGGSQAHTHTLNLDVQYVDVILASKN